MYVDPHVRRIWPKVVEPSLSSTTTVLATSNPESVRLDEDVYIAVPQPTPTPTPSVVSVVVDPTTTDDGAETSVPPTPEEVPVVEPNGEEVEEAETAISVAESAGHASICTTRTWSDKTIMLFQWGDKLATVPINANVQRLTIQRNNSCRQSKCI